MIEALTLEGSGTRPKDASWKTPPVDVPVALGVGDRLSGDIARAPKWINGVHPARSRRRRPPLASIVSLSTGSVRGRRGSRCRVGDRDRQRPRCPERITSAIGCTGTSAAVRADRRIRDRASVKSVATGRPAGEVTPATQLAKLGNAVLDPARSDTSIEALDRHDPRPRRRERADRARSQGPLRPRAGSAERRRGSGRRCHRGRRPGSDRDGRERW